MDVEKIYEDAKTLDMLNATVIGLRSDIADMEESMEEHLAQIQTLKNEILREVEEIDEY